MDARADFVLDLDDACQYVTATSRDLTLVSCDDDFDETNLERLTSKAVLNERV